MVMKEHMPLRRILTEHLGEYNPANGNEFDSPLVQMFQICEEYGLLNDVIQMSTGVMRSKESWKRVVWERCWLVEIEAYRLALREEPKLNLIALAAPEMGYSIWWSIADRIQQ